MTTDKHKFDPARAKAGEPVQFLRGSIGCSIPQSWEDVRYVGERSLGHVIEHANGELTTTHALRMKPVKTKYFVNLYVNGVARWYNDSAAAESDAKKKSLASRVIATAIEVEVER